MSLRRTVMIALAVIGAITVAVSLLLVLLTTRMHELADRATTAARSENLAEEAQANLQLLELAQGGSLGAVVAGRVLEQLEASAALADTPEEEAAAGAASQATDRYFHARVAGRWSDATQALGAAMAALDTLVTSNDAQAAAARAEVARWDRYADVMGGGAGAMLLLTVGGAVWWVGTRALRPVFIVREAMHRFALGERDVRVDPTRGAKELRDMASRFNEMCASLSDRQRAQLAFLAGVAHDLRNPITALRLTAAPGPKRDPERVLGLVERQVDRIDRLVGDLLDTTQIESGHLELELGAVDARELLGAAYELHRGISPRHQLTLDVPPDPAPLVCDARRIEQVLNNLVSNAIKYSPAGGRVQLRLEHELASVTFAVTDEGIGIAPADLARLFEPFHRTRAARTTIPGVGLGLSVARRIVEAHGGRISVTSSPSRGATFRVHLARHRG